MRIGLQYFAETNESATTTPKVSMTTELWYAKTEDFGDKKQIFMVQSIPAIQTPQEPINYGSLESTTEFQAEGTRKAESIQIPILYVEAQHNELKAIADSKDTVYFMVKLPNSTSKTQPKTFKFAGTIDIALDEISIDGLLQETLTIFKSSLVTEDTWAE